MAFGSDIAPGKYLTPEQQVQLKKVETLGLVPSHVFVVSDNLSDKTKQHLVDSMVKLNHQDYNQILKMFMVQMRYYQQLLRCTLATLDNI